jgi:8-hydroxy-5-deazaflavin:NADPH oxidoreductase
MKITILGTGTVGQTMAQKFIALGHDVFLGTRDAASTLKRTIKINNENTLFSDWLEKNKKIILSTFEDASKAGELIINALQGAATLDVFKTTNENHFDDKIIIDIANPLDFSNGFPPSLIQNLQNTNSLGEELQKALPNAKVVKTLNTMWCGLMVNPKMIGNGNHQNYICGDDADAKNSVLDILKTFGWEDENTLDLGDITNARGTEATLLIWTRVFGATKNGAFNFKMIN